MSDIPAKYVVPIIALAALPLAYFAAAPLIAAATNHQSSVAAPTDLDIKEQAQQIPYDALAREPTKYQGATVVFQGKVIQSLYDQNDKDVLLRVRVTQNVDDVVWVYYQKKSKDEPRFLAP